MVPLSERRYSDIPVHRTPSAENEAILRQNQTSSEAWKRTSFSLDQQCATLGRSDSQLLQFNTLSISDPSSSLLFLENREAFENVGSKLFPENSAIIRHEHQQQLSSGKPGEWVFFPWLKQRYTMRLCISVCRCVNC